jgi:CHAT domain-containing protein
MKRRLIIVLISLFTVGVLGFSCVSLKDTELKLRQAGARTVQPDDEAFRLYWEGDTAYKQGRYEEALKYHEKALRIYKERKMPQEVADSLNAMGIIYDSLGQSDEALKCYEEAMGIYRQLGILPSIANSLEGMGRVYQDFHRYGDALRCYEEAGRYNQEASKILKDAGIQGSGAVSLINMGFIYIELKDYQKAEELFKRAHEELGLKDREHPTMAYLYLATGRYNEALKVIEENRLDPRVRDYIPIVVMSYSLKRGYALKGLGRFKEASVDFLEAVSIIEEMRQGVKGKKAEFLEVKGRVEPYRGLVATLSERSLQGERGDNRFIPYGRDLTSAAFYFSESTKARVLLEAMAQAEKEKLSGEIPEGLRNKELVNQLAALESQFLPSDLSPVNLLYRKGSKEDKKREDTVKDLKRKKSELTSELKSLIKELREKYPQYALLYYPKPFPPEELPLKENEVLLEYALSDDAGYVFVVRKGGVKRLEKIPIGREVLEEKVKAFLEPMNTRQYAGFSVLAAKELYDIVLSGVLKDVKEDEKVIIIPDGILGLLPFDALVVKEGTGIKDSVYVGDKYTISYYQSASVLALQRVLKREPAQKVLFALGDPVFDKNDPRYIAYKQGRPEPTLLAQNLSEYAYRGLATRREWGKTTSDDKEGKELVYTPLPETEEEVKAIASLYGVTPNPPDVLLGVLANETNLRKSPLENYRYLHFATHADLPGKLQGINEPFLLLGQVENEGSDDGFLTLGEVLGLKLNADLVVLSACLTGRGKVMEGEGVANFARAFQHAGARSVVVSLWEVASNEAVEYMTTFYRHLKEGRSKSEALSLARKEIKSKYPNPFFWAPFILHGEG